MHPAGRKSFLRDGAGAGRDTAPGGLSPMFFGNILKKGRRKMSNLTEIRWHGRGGQGAKTAALLLADVAFQTGKYVQGFPEYGPERMGAPITAYNRISDTQIRVHSNIYDPQYVVVVDESLLEAVDVTNGLKKDGAILINTSRPKEELLPHLKG